jgi:hypothetical protein
MDVATLFHQSVEVACLIKRVHDVRQGRMTRYLLHSIDFNSQIAEKLCSNGAQDATGSGRVYAEPVACYAAFFVCWGEIMTSNPEQRPGQAERTVEERAPLLTDSL